ncbi:hypothetical protein PLEOSDRAFT_1105460 [Pleurotus ostreatus PC15]|uniref:Major facilitator superfamily (MFS) profile domain-containing protein n=1 Tax=Pleurotus ostreatus (strain PC15) TaxID=1137138 RepID=A0A067NSE3_PLEO1|nr:hypothetical protein PLEOSDRAFT_1105460 [Pleurotus ostreatus PC15]
MSKSDSSVDEKSIRSVGGAEAAVPGYTIDPEAEKRLLRKLDWRLLPLATAIICLNFIDRAAIGNAKIAGLERDLGMAGYDFNIALTVFYVFFVVSEVPSNLLLKRFGTVILAITVIGFGLCTLGSAFVTSYDGLIVTRVFLGISEGGTLPGLTYVLARYYRKKEFVLRLSVFFGVAPSLAGAFGGLLASGLLKVGDFGTIKSWRKIFFIEGLLTIVVGIACLYLLPADPRNTRMFNEEERALALARIDADSVVKNQGKKEKATWKLVWRAFNFNTILCSLVYLLLNISFQGLLLFMPTVIAGLGKFTVVMSQLRTVPPFLTAAVWGLIFCYLGLRLRKHAVVMLATMPLVVIGYAISIGTTNADARYAACFLVIAGAIPTGPIVYAWGVGNSAPDTVRAVTTGIIPGIGAIGSIIAVWTYLPFDAPNYRTGNTLNLVTSSTIIVVIIIGMVYIIWENAKRERGERNYRLENKSEEEIEQLGYLHPQFRYTL